MEAFLAHPGPVLLEACVSKTEHVYPMVAAGSPLDEMVLHPSLRAGVVSSEGEFLC